MVFWVVFTWLEMGWDNGKDWDTGKGWVRGKA